MTTEALRLSVLGTFHLERDSELVRLPRRKTEALLAYLVLHPQPHAREKIAALFWGDATDEAARRSLRVELAALRQLLGDDIVVADRATVQLNPDRPLWLDVRELQHWHTTLKHAPSSVPHHAWPAPLYRGDLLADFYDDWIEPLRAELRACYLDTLLSLTQHYRSQSDYARAIHSAQQMLVLDPAHEHAHQHLMFCHLANGDRTAALQQFETCQRALHNELGVEPAPETVALYHWLKQEQSDKSLAARVTNLPLPLTSFIGRQAETRDLKEAIEQSRLITLTGVGGSGKTRLAIQTATDLIDRFADGVWWVTLEAFSEGARVPQAVATALGVRETPGRSLEEALIDRVGHRRLLLLIDNCEHLIEASAQLVAVLLRHCPQLRVMATSREALRIDGEVNWPVRPLLLPRSECDQPAATRPRVVGELAELAVQYDAVRLFVERAAATRRDFEMNDANAVAIIHICRQLEGIPLAIELAAARVNALSVSDLAARLDNRFRLLTGGNRAALPRQQTLRALIDWSFELLKVDERKLFCCLAVFVGGWTLDAAEQIGADGATDVADGLARLVGKSLVLNEDGRYRLLETIRDYAHERLQETDLPHHMHDRHAHYFLATAEALDAQLKDKVQTRLLDQLDAEQNNLLAALEWLLAHEPDSALRLANALGEYWTIRGDWENRRTWFERLLAHPQLAAPTQTRASALNFAGNLTTRLRDWNRARVYFDQSLAIARGLDDREMIAQILSNLGVCASEQHRWVEARAYYEEALVLRRTLDKPRLIASSLNNLGVVAKNQGDYAAARAFYEEGLALHRRAENKQGMLAAHGNLGTLALNEQAYAAARDHITASLALARELGDKRGQAMGLGNLARIALAQQNWTEARKMLEQVYAMFRELNDRLGLAAACYDLGYTWLQLQDEAAAARYYREGLSASRAINATASLLSGLARLANLALVQHDPARVMQLLASLQCASRATNLPANVFERQFFAQDFDRARAQLTEAKFAAEWAAGERLSLNEVVDAILAAS